MEYNILLKYKDRYEAAKLHADMWRSRFEDLYKYAIPDRNYYEEDHTQKLDKDIYDTTAIKATNIFAAKMTSSLTPPKMDWGKLIPGTNIKENQKIEIARKLEPVNDLLFDYIHASNFDIVSNESYYDLAIGTACIVVNEGDDINPLQFSALPLGTFYPEEEPSGQIKTVWRDFEKVALRNIRVLWPNAEIPQSLQYGVEEDSNREIDLVEGTVYRPNTDDYHYFVFYGDDVLYEEEMKSSPWICFRWLKSSRDVFGSGPLLNVRAAILSLNKMAEYELKAAAYRVAPPLLGASDGIFNVANFNMFPGAVIPYSSIPGKPPLTPLEIGGDIRYSQLTMEDYRSQIWKALFAYPFGEMKDPTKTATEITIRQQELLEEIGPSFGRLESEYLGKLIKRVIYILVKKGLFPPIMVDGREVGIEYTAPLAQAQGIADVNRFVQYMGILQQIYGPQIAIAFLKNAKVPIEIGEKLGIDTTLINNEEELKQIAQNTMQLAATQQQLPAPPTAPVAGGGV